MNGHILPEAGMPAIDPLIDLSSDLTYTDAQINKRVLAIEKKYFTTAVQTLLARMQYTDGYVPDTKEQAAIDLWDQAAPLLEAYADQARIDNQLLIMTIDYENALVRLDHYILANGRPAYNEYIWVGTYNDEDPPQPDCTLVEHPAIAPLPPTVPSQDDDGNPIDIPNPAITQDEAERADAQATVDNATPEVIALAVEREPATVVNPCEG